MKNSFLLLTIIAGLWMTQPEAAQGQTEDTALKASKFIVEKGHLGLIKSNMTLDQALWIMPDTRVKKVIVSGEFADEQYDDYQIFSDIGHLLFTLTPAQNNDHKAKIQSISIKDPRFKSSNGIGFGSTYGQLVKAHKITGYSPDLETIHVFVESLGAQFSFSKSDLKEGWWNEDKKEIDPSKISADAKVIGFVLRWN